MGFASSSAVVLWAMAASTKTDGSLVDISTSSASRQNAAATAASQMARRRGRRSVMVLRPIARQTSN
jgi:hypothetical protein